ncbi:MAG: CinA family protein [Ferruginibacter sp.]
MTVYNLGQKCRHLSIDPIHAVDCNCVSNHVADVMALNVAQSFCSSYGIGITGYASPVPELGIEQLFAHVAVAENGRIVLSKKLLAETNEPREVQLFYTEQCVKLLNTIVANKELEPIK